MSERMSKEILPYMYKGKMTARLHKGHAPSEVYMIRKKNAINQGRLISISYFPSQIKDPYISQLDSQEKLDEEEEKEEEDGKLICFF